MYLASLLSQTSAASDPISGGAGWVGAGLLGAVLAWLMFAHLPAKDRQTRELLALFTDERERDRQARKDQSNSHSEAIKKVCDVFKEDMEAERESCERRMLSIGKSIETLANRIKT